MKAAQFDYVRAESVASCIRTLAEADGDGKILAGGQSLTPVLAMRLARPSVLVEINRIPGSRRWSAETTYCSWEPWSGTRTW